VRDANPDHLTVNAPAELFPSWRHHAVFTDSPLPMLAAEADHRRHAIVEQVIADLKNGPLAHLPCENLMANSAWLVPAAMAFNLTGAAGTLASSFHAKAATGTIRNQQIDIAARVTRSARRVTLRLPAAGPGPPPGTTCSLPRPDHQQAPDPSTAARPDRSQPVETPSTSADQRRPRPAHPRSNNVGQPSTRCIRAEAGRGDCGHAGDDTSVVRPITLWNAAPGSYSDTAMSTSRMGIGSSKLLAAARAPHPDKMIGVRSGCRVDGPT
jgi:hypothetical protein